MHVQLNVIAKTKLLFSFQREIHLNADGLVLLIRKVKCPTICLAWERQKEMTVYIHIPILKQARLSIGPKASIYVVQMNIYTFANKIHLKFKSTHI